MIILLKENDTQDSQDNYHRKKCVDPNFDRINQNSKARDM